MGVKFGLTLGKNTDWRFVRTGFWREYLDLTERQEATGDWRKLHNEELHKLLSSPNNNSDQIKEMWHAWQRWDINTWRQIPLGRPRRRWKNNIKMELEEVGCGGVNWLPLAQGRGQLRTFVKTVMNLRAP